MKILLWSERPPLSCGTKTWESLSFTSSQHDIVVLDNRFKESIDSDWLDYNIYGVLQLKPSQIKWFNDTATCKSSVPSEFGTTNRAQLVDAAFMDEFINEYIYKKLIDEQFTKIYLQPRVISNDWLNLYNYIADTADNSGKITNAKHKIINKAMDYKLYKQFGNKACLHRYIANRDEPSLFEQKGIYKVEHLSESIGYCCSNKEDIVNAYDLVVGTTGHPYVVLKDVYGAGGKDLFFMQNKKQIIQFDWSKYESNAWIVNEDLRYDHHGHKISDHQGKVEFVGVTFDNGRLYGEPMEQLLKDEAVFVGAVTYYDTQLHPILKQLTLQVFKLIGIKQCGGFDFAIQKLANGKQRFFLIDLNTGRNTSNQQSFELMERFSLHDQGKICLRKNIEINRGAKFQTLIQFDRQRQNNNGLLFNVQSGYGVFTHSFCAEPEVCEAVLTIIGKNHSHCHQLLETYVKVVNESLESSSLVFKTLNLGMI